MGIVKPFMISSDKWKALLVSDTDWTRPTIKTSFQPPTIFLFPPGLFVRKRKEGENPGDEVYLCV